MLSRMSRLTRGLAIRAASRRMSSVVRSAHGKPTSSTRRSRSRMLASARNSVAWRLCGAQFATMTRSYFLSTAGGRRTRRVHPVRRAQVHRHERRADGFDEFEVFAGEALHDDRVAARDPHEHAGITVAGPAGLEHEGVTLASRSTSSSATTAVKVRAYLSRITPFSSGVALQHDEVARQLCLAALDGEDRGELRGGRIGAIGVDDRIAAAQRASLVTANTRFMAMRLIHPESVNRTTRQKSSRLRNSRLRHSLKKARHSSAKAASARTGANSRTVSIHAWVIGIRSGSADISGQQLTGPRF